MAKFDFSEHLDAYMDQNRMYRFEGERAIKNLNQIAIDIGYDDSWLGNHPLIDMLEDNPGMCEAMVEWLKENGSPEWLQALKKSGNYTEEESDEEDE
jgi:hypothetical protein